MIDCVKLCRRFENAAGLAYVIVLTPKCLQLHLFGNQTERSAPGSLLIIDSRRTRLGQKKTISDGTFDLCRTGKTSFAPVVCIVVYRGRMTAAQFRVHFAISSLCWSQAPKPWMRRCEDVAIRAVNVCQRASEDPSSVFADCSCGQADQETT